MGLLDLLLGPSRGNANTKRPPRGKARSASEKLAAEQARYLAKLRGKNSPKYEQLMDQLMGIAPDKEDAFEQFTDMLKRIKEAGLIKNTRELVGDGDSLKEIITAVAPAVTAMVQAQTAAAAQKAALAQQQRALPQQAAAAPQASTSAPIEQNQAEPPAAQSQPPLSPRARYAKNSLENLDPPKAAQWLVGLHHPEVDQLIELVCQCPDEKLPSLLSSLGTKVPEFSGLLWWLAGRGAWLVETAAALRQLRGVGPTAQTQESAYSV